MLSFCRVQFASLNKITTKTEDWCGASKRKYLDCISIKLAHEEEPPAAVKSTLKALENLMLDPRLDCFQRNMLSPKMIIGDPSVDLSLGESGRIIRKQMGGAQNVRSVGRVNLKNKPLSIKEKISEWEGKKDATSPASAGKEEDQGVREDLSSFLGVVEKITGDGAVTREVDTKRQANWQLDCKGTSKDTERRTGMVINPGQHTERRVEMKLREEELNSNVGKGAELKNGKKDVPKENLSVLSQVKKLEQALKGGSAELQPQLPGTYYSPHCLQEKTEESHNPSEGQENASRSELGKRLFGGLDSESPEPIFGTLEEVKASGAKGRISNEENVYTEPGLPEKKPFINPLPKPRRTFKHEGEEGWARSKRNLPPLPSIPPPPLPSSPPPSAVSRRLRNGKHKANTDHRYQHSFVTYS